MIGNIPPKSHCSYSFMRYIFGIFMMLLPTVTLAAWFDTNWNYRVPVNVPAGASVNSTIKVDVDFNALLTAAGAAGTFDINSPRVVRPNDAVSAIQEFTDAVYTGATDVTGDGQGEVRFILQDAGPATYYLYFDITANGPKAVNPQPPINGNFEKDGTGTVTPQSWNIPTKAIAAMDAQVRPSENPNITGIPAGSMDSPKVTDGTPNTGQFSYLLGYRSAATMGAGNPGVTFTKTIAVPATNPGTLTVRWRPEGWDSSANAVVNFDFLRIDIQGTTTTEIVGPTAGNYVLRPFSPNFTTNAASTTTPGYGQYNGFDCSTNNIHQYGMTLACESEPWFIQTVNLTTWVGQTITLRFRFYSDGPNDRTWFHIDDVEWSVVTATLGTPEARVVNPGGFNAMEPGIAAFPVAGAIIKTKIAGTSFNLDLVALNTAKTAILTSFTGTVKVELLNSSAGGVLDANGCNAGWPTIQTLGTNPNFTTGDNGRKAVAFTENNTWPNVRVRITFPATGTATAIGCSTDNFAIRPSTFSNVTVMDNDWSTAGTTRTLNNISASGGVVHKAGQPLRLTATAVNSLNNTTTNYIGSPTATPVSCLLPAGCIPANLGTFTVGASMVAGVLTATAANYSEVGAFTLQLLDTTFANVDTADSTTAERHITSAVINVGRFVPNHFDVTTNSTPTFKTFNNTTCTSRSFTYIGQPFGYVTVPQALISAKNAAGNITQNYRNTLWRPTPTHVYSSVSGTLDTALTNLPTVLSNSNGTGTSTVGSTDLLAYTRNLITPQTPFNANISLTLSVSDTSETGVAGNGTIASVATAVFNGGGSGIAFDSGNAFRYGRLRLSNAHGSELLNLPVSMETQHWTGTSFITNTADQCTTITNANMLLRNPQKNLALGETGITVGGTFSNGKSTNLMLNKPSGGDGLYNGSVDICVDLGTDTPSAGSPPATNTAPVCIATTPANMPWLQGRWSEINYDDDPVVRGTFGIYKNANENIYMREVY